MSEVVGEAIVVVRTDETQVDTDGAGRRAGQGFSAGFGGVLKRLAGAAVVTAAAAGVAKTFTTALNLDAAGAKMQAQLGLTEDQAAAAGRVAGELYADNFGDSLGQVQDTAGVVLGSIKGLREGSEADLAAATRAAQGYADVFETDVETGVQAAARLINNELAGNAVEAFDLLTRSSQQVPEALRQDLFDATDEYSQFFSQIGLDGQQAFGALVTGADQGMFGIDKAGDAIKEFTIRSTDMSTASTDAYARIGLDAREMANAILAGGDDAAGATQQIIDGLLAVEDPADQANAAIALFGTPLEDLGVRRIPDFLRGLQGTGTELGKVASATEDAVETMAATPLVRAQGLWRGLQGAILGVATQALDPVVTAIEGAIDAGGRLIPLVTGALEPALGELGETLGGGVVPAVLDTVGGIGSGLLPLLGMLAGIATGQVIPAVTEVAGVLGENLVPFLQTAGGTIVGTVVPALVALAGYVVQNVLPVLATIGGIIINDIIPPLIALAGWVYSTVIPAVVGLVTTVAQKLRPIFDAFIDVLLTRVLPTVAALVAQVRDNLVPALAPVIERVGQVVGFLIRLAATILGAVLPPLIQFAGFLFEHLAPLVVSIVTGLVRFVGVVLELGAALVNAVRWVFDFATALGEGIGRGVDWVIDAITGLPGMIAGLGRKMLDAGKTLIGSFVRGLAQAPGVVADIAGNVWTAVKGMLNSAIDRINSALEFTIRLPGPDITINPPDIPRLQYGTSNFGGGMAWVGEVGPELVSLPRGSRVIPAQRSTDMAAAAGGGQAGAVYIGTMMPHDYGEFTRQVDERRRLAAVGGRRP